jgi:hypothetical protein
MRVDACSSNANQTGRYVPSGRFSFSEKLVNGTTQRFWIPSQRRQWGDLRLRTLVTQSTVNPEKTGRAPYPNDLPRIIVSYHLSSAATLIGEHEVRRRRGRHSRSASCRHAMVRGSGDSAWRDAKQNWNGLHGDMPGCLPNE